MEVKEVDYLDGYQYAGGVLQFFPHGEGYISATPNSIDINGVSSYFYNYVFNYTDHLGNVRISYTRDPGSNQLKILEENHYYPFGLKHSIYSTGHKRDYVSREDENSGASLPPVVDYVTSTRYQYKFGAKEWQDELGLNIYDYEARNYDPAFVRTLTMDPLAEQYYSASPYSLFNNNPLRYADPTGMKGEDWIKQIGTNGQQTFTYDATVKTVQDAKDKGYENVESVGEYNISGNGYSYDLNNDGSVVYNSPINTSTYVDRKDDFTTPGGRTIKGFCNGCTYSQSYLSSTSNSYFLGDPSRRIAMGVLQGGADAAIGYGIGKGATVVGGFFRNSTRADMTVYRVFGGDARAQGFSWTTTDPRTVGDFRNLAGLPSGGESGAMNTADFMLKGTVNSQNIIKSRSALPLDGNAGGLPEYIIDPKNVNITGFSVLNP